MFVARGSSVACGSSVRLAGRSNGRTDARTARLTAPDGPPNGPDGPDGPPNGPDSPPNDPDSPPNSPDGGAGDRRLRPWYLTRGWIMSHLYMQFGINTVKGLKSNRLPATQFPIKWIPDTPIPDQMGSRPNGFPAKWVPGQMGSRPNRFPAKYVPGQMGSRSRSNRPRSNRSR